MANGISNGVKDLEIITDTSRLRAMEPEMSQSVIAALYCPTAGVVAPYEYTIALAENAVANGVDIWLEHTVCEVVQKNRKYVLKVAEKEQLEFHGRYVVNAAGVHADMVAAFAGAAGDFHIVPRKGEYIVLDKQQGGKINHVLFQCPSEAHGKGVLVSPTANGNLILGPSSVYSDSVDVSTSFRQLRQILRTARKTFPALQVSRSITSFAGIRPNSDLDFRDFVIQECDKRPGWINVAGIGSPGLTASYPIALRVVQILTACGLELEGIKPDWDGTRAPLAEPWPSGARVNHPDPRLNLVCVCEGICEQSIANACNAGIPVTTIDAVKRRTRATMGQCQGRRCRRAIRKIVAEQSGLDLVEVTRRGSGLSHEFEQEWIASSRVSVKRLARL
eukprot:TRINITY_DN3789_c0_g3_i2.p1 TRINITY_DN3789_c0_g3~~TRINITY_DN3789_c0_g3_i2.p1  ORF type:complete len:391 (+),score=62.84 TRINITY_DN3789_c0_g3_i2:757-1929(+)